MAEVDPEVLIPLVQARPALWDKTCEAYKDRSVTRDAWREICEELKPNFNEVDDDEKNLFGKEVIRRWTNIRDGFARSRKLTKENKLKNGKRHRKYIFFDQLLFLNKMYENLETEDNMKSGTKLGSDAGLENSMEEDTELQASTEDGEDLHKKNAARKRTVQDKKHRKPDEVELRILEALETEKPNSRMSFLQSLMPHLNKFSEQDFLQFQMEVLKLIENIQERKKKKVGHQPPVFNYSTPVPSYQLFPMFPTPFTNKPTPLSHSQEFANQMSCFIPQLVHFLSQNPSLLSQMTTCSQPPTFFSQEPRVSAQQHTSSPPKKRTRSNNQSSNPHPQSTSQDVQQFAPCTSPESDLYSQSAASPESSIPDNVDFSTGD